jgi:hypothetical protein
LQCRNCHTEHKGEYAAITDLSNFDHDCAAFALTGKHKSVACAQCHKDNKFKGTPTTCVSCHAEPTIHAGSKLGTDCAKCHTTTTWTGGTLGDFKHSFPITHGGGGGKKPKACAMCHKPADQFKTYTCYECHRQKQQSLCHGTEQASTLFRPSGSIRPISDAAGRLVSRVRQRRSRRTSMPGSQKGGYRRLRPSHRRRCI